jgi:hypothetical protein
MSKARYGSGVLTRLLCGLVGGCVAHWLLLRKARNQDQQASAALAGGRTVVISGKMRLRGRRGWNGRWREVVIECSTNGHINAKPFRPRLAARFDLSQTRSTGARDARSFEKWWFAGPVVLLADGNLGPIEFGFGTAAGFENLRRQLDD